MDCLNIKDICRFQSGDIEITAILTESERHNCGSVYKWHKGILENKRIIAKETVQKTKCWECIPYHNHDETVSFIIWIFSVLMAS